jgi:hypothetical protein
MGAAVDDQLKRHVQVMLQLALQIYKMKKAGENKNLKKTLKDTQTEGENLKQQKNISDMMKEKPPVNNEELVLAQSKSFEFLAHFEATTREQLEFSKNPKIWEQLEVVDARNLWVVANVQKQNPNLTQEQRDYYSNFEKEVSQKAQERWQANLEEKANNIGDIVKVRDMKNLDETLVIDLSEENPELATTKLSTSLVKKAKETTLEEESPVAGKEDLSEGVGATPVYAEDVPEVFPTQTVTQGR